MRHGVAAEAGALLYKNIVTPLHEDVALKLGSTRASGVSGVLVRLHEGGIITATRGCVTQDGTLTTQQAQKETQQGAVMAEPW